MKGARGAAAGLVTGLELTQKALLQAFETNGLKRVAPEAGEAFNPHLHQAMMEQPSDTVAGGTVIQTMQAGYELFGRTVRPAMVVVAAKGSGAASNPYASAPASGQAFDGKRVHLPLLSSINGKAFGKPNAGVDMTFDFPTLVSHAVKTRPLMGGAIIGSGTVSNRDTDGGPGKPVPDGGVGYSCLAEIRTVETILHGAPKTPYLNFGDRVRIEMNDAQGRSIFGAIDHEVVRV